jgi:adenosyl cobinamide kinase/adenosyl cobinamide phosphate guanylyltransferase
MATQAVPLPWSSSTKSGAPVTLVLGGARSGKSRHAEGVIADLRAPNSVYVATAEAGDAEMRARIAEHRARRGAGWTTLEAPLDLIGALDQAGVRPALIDCLTLWVSNLLHAGRDVAAEGERLIGALALARAPVVLVSNEVGLGIVPENALARAFRDHAGRLNQRIAAMADRVVFVAAGLPLILKETR